MNYVLEPLEVSRSRASKPAGSTGKDRSQVRVVSGRLVSATLGDPEIRQEMHASRESRGRDPEALRAKYVKMGLLTKSGALAKRYRAG